MKRLALLALLLVALPAAAFTLISFQLSPATPLVWYEAHGPGTGTLSTLSGFNSLTAAATNVAHTQRMYQRIKPLRLAFTVQVAGVGGGNFTYEAFDTTSGASICVSGNVACTTAAGALSLDCAAGTATAAAADDVTLRINASGCTNSPTGTISLEYTEALADEGVDFLPRFVPYGQFGLDGGGMFFGFDSYQFDTVTCSWRSAGVVSGGTDTMRVDVIQKSDAGVVCTCDLPGTCADGQNTEHTCTCSGGRKYIGTQVEPGRVLGQGYTIQLNSATNCALNPRGWTCAIPFRK